MNHLDPVAIRKAGIEGWEPYKYEAAGDAVIITGGVPRLLKSGARKGKPTWAGCKASMVVVTKAERDAEEAHYEATTGNCGRCFGKGEVFASWHHIDGTKYRPCPHCDASGKSINGKTGEA